MNKPRATAGFTLVEMLIVVAIIAILASVLIFNASAARVTAKREAARVQGYNASQTLNNFLAVYNPLESNELLDKMTSSTQDVPGKGSMSGENCASGNKISKDSTGVKVEPFNDDNSSFGYAAAQSGIHCLVTANTSKFSVAVWSWAEESGVVFKNGQQQP